MITLSSGIIFSFRTFFTLFYRKLEVKMAAFCGLKSCKPLFIVCLTIFQRRVNAVANHPSHRAKMPGITVLVSNLPSRKQIPIFRNHFVIIRPTNPRQPLYQTFRPPTFKRRFLSVTPNSPDSEVGWSVGSGEVTG